ncbi:MAG: AAA family ATPase, partial [Bdellovibrionales bacterium]
ELFAGRLPFVAHDEMEWVHNHIAQTETPLHEVNAQIPRPISLIVQKLMKKSPEERYQSCLGILHDLDACLKMQNPLDFRAGANDVSSEFRLSSKLYGREDEIKLVNRVLAKVVMGGKRLILVDGDPGVGKSTLVNVVKNTANASSGYFIFGKYDQFRKDIPFSALIQAFNQFVAQILTEDEVSIAAWKEKILKAMGDNAAIVTVILPQIELITGKVPPVQQLETNEQRQRFQQTFHSFIRVCCERGRPLVIFLDDLQWADSASRSLMQMFLTEKDAESLLFIGAYRDGEVGPTHPLRQLLADLAEKELESDHIHLTNLALTNIEDLIGDSFPVSTSDRRSLAQLVFEKTNGNPFFVSQFLKTLYEKRLLRFDPFAGWTWDLEPIRSEDVTSNVLTLLGDKIAGLASGTQDILQLAACFGNYFKADELKIYNGKSDIENSILLQPAVEIGLLSAVGQGGYKFIHDRVQEAAYGMMSVEKREDAHWQIARRLLSIWPAEKVRDGIFYLVNHWNAGATRINCAADREKSAELNLMAANRAKDSSVHDLAFTYAVAGESLLASDDWAKYEHYLKPLLLMRASCEYTLARHEDSHKTFQKALTQMTVPTEKARVYRTMADLAHVQGHNPESLRWAVLGLELLGMRIPKAPNKFVLLKMMLTNRRLLRARMKSGVKESKQPDRAEDREILLLLASIAAPAYSINKSLLAYIGLASVELSLKNGFLDFGGRSLFCAYLWSQLQDFGETKRSVDYIVEQFDPAEAVPSDYRSVFGLVGFSYHIVNSYNETIRRMDQCGHLLTLNGDVLYAANAAIHAGAMVFFSERKLSRTEERYSKYHEMIRSLNYQIAYSSSKSFETMIHWMAGIAPEEHTEKLAENYDFSRAQGSPLPVSWFYMTRLFVDFMNGDYRKAFVEIEHYEFASGNVPFTSFAIHARVISSIVRLKNVSQLSGFKKIKQLIKVRMQMRFFKKLSEQNPTNFKAAYLLLVGEWHSMRGRYTQAINVLQASIHAAKQSEIVMYEPLANEMLAQVFFKQGMDKIGLLCLREAVFLYENWGAAGKVASLLARHPQLSASTGRSASSQDSTGTISLASSQKLDLDTVLKATNTLVSEVDMSRLVKKMLNILIENAGAERGVLFLMENQHFVAKGEISINSSEEFKLTDIKFEEFVKVPHAMVTYVARTHETMVLENSMEDDRLKRDEYVRSHQVLSSVCLPILAQGELRGVVYLENNAARGVFSPERVELMTILAGQIAISLENARLYHQQGEAVRMQNELVTAHAVQEMLFPAPVFEIPNVRIAGYYQPATECGGDWWSYSKIGDWIYVYIGDATGHGAPA